MPIEMSAIFSPRIDSHNTVVNHPSRFPRDLANPILHEWSCHHESMKPMPESITQLCRNPSPHTTRLLHMSKIAEAGVQVLLDIICVILEKIMTSRLSSKCLWKIGVS